MIFLTMMCWKEKSRKFIVKIKIKIKVEIKSEYESRSRNRSVDRIGSKRGGRAVSKISAHGILQLCI